MTQLTIACPEALVEDANNLAAVVSAKRVGSHFVLAHQ